MDIKMKQLLLLLLLSLISSMPALARDVANEQYMVTAAQREYDQIKADFDAATLLVKEQERRIAQEQAHLKEQQQKQSAAKEALVKAKTQLDKQQKALDRAWNKGDK